MKGKTHDLNHDLTFSAHTFNCVCHSIRSMFRVLGINNFGSNMNKICLSHTPHFLLCWKFQIRKWLLQYLNPLGSSCFEFEKCVDKFSSIFNKMWQPCYKLMLDFTLKYLVWLIDNKLNHRTLAIVSFQINVATWTNLKHFLLPYFLI